MKIFKLLTAAVVIFYLLAVLLLRILKTKYRIENISNDNPPPADTITWAVKYQDAQNFITYIQDI